MPLPFLSPVFTDHMVFQRNQTDRIWGWTAPGSQVDLEIGNVKARTVAAKDGKWTISFPAPPTGGPYTLKLSGAGAAQLNDILVGDVWLCSGQSNMEMGIHDTLNAAEETAKADHPQIRLFLAEKKIAYSPQPTLAGPWKVCSPRTLAEGGWGGFSAVAYHFGVELNQRLKVPIGLVQIAWGGSAGESWVSPAQLAPIKDFDANLGVVKTLDQKGFEDIGCVMDAWMALNDPGTVGKYENADTLPWGTAKPVVFPVNNSFLGAPKGAGVGWYRSQFKLDPDSIKGGFIHLGNMNATDRVYVNGHQVGSGGWIWERNYPVPASVLKGGINTVTVRLVTTDESGGFLGKAQDPFIQVAAPGEKMPLTDWQGVLTCDFSKSHPNDMSPAPNLPGVLNHGMVAPLAPMAVKGAIWYQGETNVGRALQYEKILAALMADWRAEFRSPKMPFYIVSLANFQDRQDNPVDFSWAEFRASQAKAAQADPHSGIAITIDIGDAHDIHPKNKQSVGHRLAIQTLAKDEGMKIEFSGPVFKAFVVQGSTVKVTFTHAVGLYLKDGKPAFALAGEDRKWHWATAKVDAEAVILTCPEVPHPVAVHYGWQSNPEAPLYNQDHLPAIPFRSDTW